MKQFQFAYRNPENFEENLLEFKKQLESKDFSNMFFQIYSEVLEPEKISEVCRVFDTCQKYKTLQTAEMRAFLCQILFIFMLYGVVLYAIIRYEALVR